MGNETTIRRFSQPEKVELRKLWGWSYLHRSKFFFPIIFNFCQIYVLTVCMGSAISTVFLVNKLHSTELFIMMEVVSCCIYKTG
jgi:hypothetical protein